MEPAYRYRATLRKMIDADTLLMDVDLGFRVAVAIPIRLRGVNAPEIGTEAGQAAATWVDELLGKADVIIIESYKNRRSFERWVADVYVDGKKLADSIIEAGHGIGVQ